MAEKLAKIRVDLEVFQELLKLPDDVTITSIYTKRLTPRGPREQIAEVYLKCDRFKEIGFGEDTPEISFEEIINAGMWDRENNG